MSINRFEAVGILVSVGLMALGLFLVNMTNTAGNIGATAQPAAVVVSDDQVAGALGGAVNANGDVEQLIIDDVVVGTGDVVAEGDQVVVHYIGSLSNGQQFDNSYNRGTPFVFTVGAGEVIAGWEEGLLGMQVGGQRILVIPPALAYGDRVVGPIPAGSTLVFAIELLEIL